MAARRKELMEPAGSLRLGFACSSESMRLWQYATLQAHPGGATGLTQSLLRCLEGMRATKRMRRNGRASQGCARKLQHAGVWKTSLSRPL